MIMENDFNCQYLEWTKDRERAHALFELSMPCHMNVVTIAAKRWRPFHLCILRLGISCCTPCSV